MPKEPDLSSVAAPWRGVYLETHASTANEVKDVSSPNFVVILKLSAGALSEWQFSGESVKRVQVTPGAISIVPALVPFSARTQGSGDLLLVELEPAFLYRSAHDLLASDRLQIRPQVGIEDFYLQAAASALKEQAEAGYPGGRCYGESIAASMAVHLVSKFSDKELDVRDSRGGLAPYQLRRAKDFIHAQLGDDVSLTEMAAAVGLSAFHFARSFKASTGLTPHQYLVKCRLERAREMLLAQDRSISEVALLSGFCDQSHLSAHFKRLYGVTPKQFMREARR
jgi:AraC family transcriptional regulator